MFNPQTDPIRTLDDIRAVNAVAVSSTGIFDPGYLEGFGERIVGSPVVSTSDMGHVIVESAAGYSIMFYQRTRHTNGVGLHNYMDSRRFSHAQSARRYARTF